MNRKVGNTAGLQDAPPKLADPSVEANCTGAGMLKHINFFQDFEARESHPDNKVIHRISLRPIFSLFVSQTSHGGRPSAVMPLTESSLIPQFMTCL